MHENGAYIPSGLYDSVVASQPTPNEQTIIDKSSKIRDFEKDIKAKMQQKAI